MSNDERGTEMLAVVMIAAIYLVAGLVLGAVFL